MNRPPLGLLQRIRTYLQKNDSEKLKSAVESAVPVNVAWCLMRLPVQSKVRLLTSEPPEIAVKIFSEMDLSHQMEVLKLGRLPALIKIVGLLDSDDLADVLGALDPLEKAAWIKTLPEGDVTEAESLLMYPPNTAGGLMAKEYIAVPFNLTAGEVAERLQGLANNYEHLKATYVYVLDDQGGLVGVLSMRDLVFKSPDTPISKFMISNVASIMDTASSKETAQMFRDQDLLALPVVNGQGKLLGVITSDDVLDVIEELANADMMKLARVSVDETRDSPIKRIIRRRLSWLSVNILLNLISASVITLFEDTLLSVISLAFFIPIISDMSGCSGMQAVTVSVRDLAVGKILPTDYWRVLRKELAIGFLNGLVLGLIIGLVALALKGIPMLGVVVALALWLNNIIAVTFGGILPLFLKFLKKDPALASGPILTTITDMMGFTILLGLATIWLPWLHR